MIAINFKIPAVAGFYFCIHIHYGSESDQSILMQVSHYHFKLLINYFLIFNPQTAIHTSAEKLNALKDNPYL